VTEPVEVAVAILVRADGRILLAQRPREKVYSGYWEFPGGKVEPGEPVVDALAREVLEELGVDVTRAYPWIVRRFVYPHATVRLNFFRVTAWRGELQSVEGQMLSWQDPAAVDVAPMLPANAPVLKALQLPAEYAITQASVIGVDESLQLLELRLRDGLRLIQVREKQLDPVVREGFARAVIEMSAAYGARVLINADIELARRLGAAGVHLTAQQLSELTVRPDLDWCAASCHSSQELRLAEALDLDFAVLGPVKSTLTHPEAVPTGWESFGATIADAIIPVYAIGGMKPDDLEVAWSHGAHGLAMLRAAWVP
jgi:8-oxo-dGTP diphosphatase